MAIESAKKSLFNPPAYKKLDNTEEIQPISDEGYGDRISIVVPIRKDLNQIILTRLEDDLKWNQAIVSNGCANDSPEWTGRVKKATLAIKSIEKKIVDIKMKMEKG